MQKLTCIGRITRDLELRYSNDNKPIIYLPVAVINSSKNAKPIFLDFISYGEVAKKHAQYLAKGSLVYIEAHIYQITVENEDGTKTKKDKYYVDRIEYLNTKKSVEQQATENQNTTEISSDPFQEFSSEIELTDDMLPF